MIDVDAISGMGAYGVEVQHIEREGENAKERTLYYKMVDGENVDDGERDGAADGGDGERGDAADSNNGERGKVFLVVNPNTIEVRTDDKLGKLLREKYESVMESRYFGRNGVEIVLAGQLEDDELEDLVRLSYNMS